MIMLTSMLNNPDQSTTQAMPHKTVKNNAIIVKIFQGKKNLILKNFHF
jgi:hypothetical protein